MGKKLNSYEARVKERATKRKMLEAQVANAVRSLAMMRHGAEIGVVERDDGWHEKIREFEEQRDSLTAELERV